MYKFLKPVIFLSDPEWAHNVVISISKTKLASNFLRLLCQPGKFNRPVTVAGLTFPNQVGLAAGFDKNGEVVPAMAALGFGFIEVGTVTPLPQPGNPKPRLFRLPEDQAIINRMGFNNDGVQVLKQNIKQINGKKFVLGINIGKNKATPLEKAIDDYLYSFVELYDLADYFTINISSPNTPGLRQLQNREYLERLFMALNGKRREFSVKKPVFVKIAPDLTYEQIDGILQLVSDYKIDGLVATNTTIDRPKLKAPAKIVNQQGGLSGKPLKNRSTQIISYIRKKMPQLAIIGSGGIITPDDAIEKLDAGADLIQIFTGLIYQGPCLVKKIKKTLYYRDLRDKHL